MNDGSARVRYVVRFSGHVQGVGFRATTVEQSRGLAVHGFVRNEPDGSVRLDMEGSEESLRELLRRIRDVMRSYIDDVEVHEEPTEGREGPLQIVP